MGTPPSASNPARDLVTRNWARKVAQNLQNIPPQAKTPASDKPQASSHKLEEVEADLQAIVGQ